MLTRQGMLVITSLMFISSCVTTPTVTDFSVTLPGNYQAIADCAYPYLRKEDLIWSKVDFPSEQKTELVFANDAVEAAKIVVTSVGTNSTRVDSYMSQWRKGYWESKHRPIFDTCSQTVTSKTQPENQQ
jgi:hypothetical protein